MRARQFSGVSGPERRQRTQQGRPRVDGHAPRHRRSRHAVGDDVQHLRVAYAWRLELPRVARVVHAVLVPARAAGRSEVAAAGGCTRRESPVECLRLPPVAVIQDVMPREECALVTEAAHVVNLLRCETKAACRSVRCNEGSAGCANKTYVALAVVVLEHLLVCGDEAAIIAAQHVTEYWLNAHERWHVKEWNSGCVCGWLEWKEELAGALPKVTNLLAKSSWLLHLPLARTYGSPCLPS